MTVTATTPTDLTWEAHPGGRHTATSAATGHKAIVQTIQHKRLAWMLSAPNGRRVASGFEGSLADAKGAVAKALPTGGGTRAALPAHFHPWAAHDTVRLRWVTDTAGGRVTAKTPGGQEATRS